MSRLDSHIRRLLAQRAVIDRAADLIRDIPGPILELGLGNGRTYDHLRERFPDREIFVFDFEIASHPDSQPDPGHFIAGDFRTTLATAGGRIGAPAALAHCDIGSHSVERSRALAAAMAIELSPLLAPGAIVLCDQTISMPDWTALPLPPRIIKGRYYIYEAGVRRAPRDAARERSPRRPSASAPEPAE
jgi:hypothetical protein